MNKLANNVNIQALSCPVSMEPIRGSQRELSQLQGPGAQVSIVRSQEQGVQDFEEPLDVPRVQKAMMCMCTALVSVMCTVRQDARTVSGDPRHRCEIR